MVEKKSELSVITSAKKLCSYVLTVTQKSPKHFRYTFVTRLQNLALEVVENLIRANDIPGKIHTDRKDYSFNKLQ